MTPITKDQWKSVARNAVFAGVSAFVIFLSTSADPFSKTALKAGAVLALTTAIKIVEKLFTQS